MLNFFRRIRKSLLASGTARKYILYVVGEVLLVMVGILLALQVNNWNQGKLERNSELKILASLHADFTENQNRIQSQIKLENRLITAISTLLNLTTNVQQDQLVRVTDSLLAATLPSPTFDPVTTALDAAMAAGFIKLIHSEYILEQLAKWQSVVSDMRQDELAVRSIVNELIVPELGENVKLTHLYENVVEWSLGDPEASILLERSQMIRASFQLENVVATQLFNKRFVLSSLKEISNIQTELLNAIGAELE